MPLKLLLFGRIKGWGILSQSSSVSTSRHRVAMRITGDPLAENNGLFFKHGDHLGSSTMMTKIDGTTVAGSVAYYMPFGEYRGTAPVTNMRNNMWFMSDLGFTGHQHNNDLGLVYMNARFYVPGVGKFASADTIIPAPTNPQSYNRYAYVLNNPLNYIDPSGHCATFATKNPLTGEIINARDIKNDGSCWEQYDQLYRSAFSECECGDPTGLIGTGEDYQQRDDFDLMMTLHDQKGMKWSELLPYQWSLGGKTSSHSNCEGIVTCNFGYELMTWKGKRVLRNGEEMYKTWYYSEVSYHNVSESEKFRLSVDAANSASWEVSEGYGMVSSAYAAAAICLGVSPLTVPATASCLAGALALEVTGYAKVQSGEQHYRNAEIEARREWECNLSADLSGCSVK